MNIWEIVSITDLIKIIKEHPKQFIMLGITLDNNSADIKIYIKKFLKQKSKIYPNMIFLYFKANIKDLGKISLLDKDVNLYPLMYSIYDVSTVFIKITSAVQESIEEAFTAGKEYYDNDLHKFNESKNKPKNIIINNIQQENKPEENKEEDIKNNVQESGTSWKTLDLASLESEAFLLGIIIYGVYNTTSLAIYKKYTWKVATMDTLWGGILLAITTAVLYCI